MIDTLSSPPGAIVDFLEVYFIIKSEITFPELVLLRRKSGSEIISFFITWDFSKYHL